MPRHKAATNCTIRPWLSERKDCREGRFIQVGNSLLLSKAFQRLNGNAKHLYLCMALESGGNRDVKFTHSQAKKYGISSTSFDRSVKELQDHRFIELITDGSGFRPQYAPNVYRFTFEWKTTSHNYKDERGD